MRTAVEMVEKVEEEEQQSNPTSAQAETSSPSWSSAAFSESRDLISTAIQGSLGLYLPSLAGEMTGALNSATRAETSSPTWSSADFSETR